MAYIVLCLLCNLLCYCFLLILANHTCVIDYFTLTIFFYHFSKLVMQVSLSLICVQEDQLLLTIFNVFMIFFGIKLYLV